jgi:hypothetical protein
LHVATFAAVVFTVFWINADTLFLRWDGTQHLTETAMQFRWGGPLLSMHLDPLRGSGEFSHLNNYRLNPGMALGHWLGGPANAPAIAAGTSVVLYFLAIGAGLRLVGLGWAHAFAAAWAVCLAVLPFHVPPPTFIRAWGNMPLLPGFGAAFLALALWWRVGEPGRAVWRDAADAAAILSLIAWLATALPATAAMTGPALLWFGAARLIGTDPVARRRCLIAGAALALALAPFAFHAIEIHAFSKSGVFFAEMYQIEAGIRQASFLIYIHGEASALGEAIVWAAPAGALVFAVFSAGARRRFALAYLGLFATIFGLAGLFELFDASWGGPPLAYIDLTLLPLHLAYALAPLFLLVRSFARFTRLSGAAGFAALILPWALVPWAAWRHASPEYLAHRPWPWPQPRTELVELLEREIGLRENADFRGRLASLAGLRRGTHPFHAQHAFETELMHASGNDHRANGLWFRDVPTLSTTNHLTSPFFQAAVTRLLGDPGTASIRNHLPIAGADPRILALFGARYVLSEAPVPGLGDARVFDLGPFRLHLHELSAPNLGTYSALTTIRAHDTRAALALLADPEHDPRKTTILHERVPETLARTRGAKLAFARDSATFEARADAVALAILPLEFTRCFEIAFESSGNLPPRALRANAAQTAILFETDVRATIRLRFGPFVNVGCRFADWADARALDLERVVGWWPQTPAR